MIELRIHAVTPVEFAEALGAVIKNLTNTQTAALPITPAPTPAADPAPAKASTRKKAEAVKPTEPEAPAETPAETAIGAEADSAGADVETSECNDSTEAETPAEAPAVKVTMDNARAYAVAYVNDAAPDQVQRKQLFQEIITHFGVAKFSDIPEGRLQEAVDLVKKKRVDAGLPATELAA